MALLTEFSYNSLNSDEEKIKKKKKQKQIKKEETNSKMLPSISMNTSTNRTSSVRDMLKTINNNGSKEKIDDAKNNYNYSKKINKYLESNYRQKAAQNNIVLPFKNSDFTSIKSLKPNNFTIVENAKKENARPSNMIIDIDTLKNKQNIYNKVDPLSLDITSKLKEGVENVKRYNDYIKRPDVRSDLVDLKNSRNEVALDRYNLDLEKINNKNINMYDKTLGRLLRGAKSMLPTANTTYTRDDGVEVNLPTYNDLLEQKTTENYNTAVGKFLGEATANIGRIVTSSVVNKILPGVGTTAYFGDMFADQYNNNLLEGYDEKSSLMNATIGTVSEAVTEKLLGGVSSKIFGGNSSELSTQIAKGLSKLTKDKRIVNIFSNASSEAIEEFVQSYTDKLNDQITLQENVDLKDLFSKDTFSEAMYSAGIGAISGGVLSTFGKVDSNISDIIDNKYNNLNNSSVNNQDINNTLLDEDVNTTDSFENKYIAVPSQNNKITDFRNSVQNSNAIANEKNAYVMNTIEKVIKDKNYNVLFDSSITNKKGDSVDGLITSNSDNEIEIRLNPNSNRSVEFLLAHEITHSIETTELKDLVLNFAAKNDNFNEALKSLQKTYDTTDVSSEVLADISGQLLGNQEFINNLKMDNTLKSKNIIKTIYESIKRLLNNLTEKGRYRNFVKDLESKWADAYKNVTAEQSIDNFKSGEKYMMTSISGMNNGIKNNQNKYQNIKDRYDAAIFLEEKKYSNEQIRQITGWFKNKTNQWEFEISDHNTKFKKQLLKNSNYKLSDIFEATTLYEMYPGLKDVSVEFKKLKRKNGGYNSESKKITINNQLLNNLDNLKGTLLHEIQHYIQREEGLPTGTTILFGNEQYANSLGEIEAADIKNRRNFTVDQRKNIVPESAKDNPTHPNRDTILNHKRTIVEQIAEKVYNKNKGENYNEISEENDIETSKMDNSKSNKKDSNGLGINRRYDVKELDNSSFSLEQRVSGDELLDAQDLIEEIKSVGANVDKNGYVTLYHQTTNENADKIKQSGKMIAKEPYVYFSTSKGASQSDGRGNTKLEFKIPAEKLILDDIFDDNADVKVKLDNSKMLDVSNYLMEKNKNLKYSMQENTSNSWQKYLEKNYKVRGTTTKFSEFILPKYKEKITETNQVSTLPKGSDELKKEKLLFNSDEYLKDDASKNFKGNNSELKKQNIQKIDNNKVTISKLEESREQTLKNIDSEIKNKRKLYNSKKSKDTKIANLIQQQIITLESRKKSISEAYKQRIDRIEDRNKKLSSKENYTNLQRKSKIIEYRELAESIIIDNIDSWTDKNTGLAYKMEKMERNFYDIIPDKKIAKQMVDTYITPLKIAENNQKNFVNEYVNKIKKLNLSNEEAVAVQLLGEAKFNISTINDDTARAKRVLNSLKTNQDVKDNAQFYLDALDYIKTNNLDINKIQSHVKDFRKIYNELFLKINKVLKEQGYKEMDYKENYFPHFVEEHATSKIGKLMEKLGWKNYNNKIPTDIAGRTDMFKPGKTYFRHLEHRYGNVTEYNALKGFDHYISGASNLIFLTEPIQKLRGLENEIRYLHSEKGVQEKYNEIIMSDLDTDTKEAQIIQLFANANNPLNNLVTELRSYTDGIANKKSELDRRLEQAFNRGIYSTMTNIQNRVSANMVGMNISSALTNFIPITQAYSQVSTKNMLKAIKSTLANSITSDGFVENSEFLSNRLIKSEKLYTTGLEKVSEKVNIMFDAVDSFTSNVVTRAKYFENIDKGMTPVEALKNADTFANNVIAGRDKASLPTIFNAKNPFVKLFSSFQLEVNNQYKYMLKDLPSDLKDETLNKLIGAFVKMFFGAWFYNFFAEKITGRKSAFSPADLILDSMKTIQNDNGSAFDKSVTILKDVAGEVPFLGNILGGGRLPISSALPNLENSIEAISTMHSKTAKESTKQTALNNLKKELMKPVYYIIPPFGGGQLKKSIEGASIHLKDVPGSYTPSGRLRFTAERGLLPTAKDLLFGQYSSKSAREYFDNNYEPLTQKQQKEFLKLDVDLTTYRKYYADFKEIDKIKGDKDENDKTVGGTATAKKVFEILNGNKDYSEKELNYLFSKLSTETYDLNFDDISLLENDIDVYKYYFGLSTSSKYSFINLIDKTSINQKEYINTMKYISETKKKYKNIENPYHGNEYSAYKTYLSKLKKEEIYSKINSLEISKFEKILLYKSAGYSINNQKEYLFNYINNLKITKTEKHDLWEYLYSDWRMNTYE